MVIVIQSTTDYSDPHGAAKMSEKSGSAKKHVPPKSSMFWCREKVRIIKHVRKFRRPKIIGRQLYTYDQTFAPRPSTQTQFVRERRLAMTCLRRKSFVQHLQTVLIIEYFLNNCLRGLFRRLKVFYYSWFGPSEWHTIAYDLQLQNRTENGIKCASFS